MSSYLAFRYIERNDVNFFAGLHHKNFVPATDKIKVSSADDIDAALTANFAKLRGKKLGLMLSGGMDSAILATYMPGCDAYTFTSPVKGVFDAEVARAEYYAETYDLRLHRVEINWQTIEPHIDIVMRAKGAPVHSIDLQIFLAAKQMKNDGIDIVVTGEGCDSAFGGLDKLLSRDWSFDEFVNRYTYLDPAAVLNEPADVSYLFERYRRGNGVDVQKFIREVYGVENGGSFVTAFEVAQIDHTEPYGNLEMAEPLDLQRVRNGESKYLIRELFAKKYPNFPAPDKVPLPRPVDFYFADWQGPTRPEFKRNLDMTKFTGNQKWQLYCLERFLNLFEPLR